MCTVVNNFRYYPKKTPQVLRWPLRLYTDCRQKISSRITFYTYQPNQEALSHLNLTALKAGTTPLSKTQYLKQQFHIHNPKGYTYHA